MRAFTLIELMVVIVIITILGVAAGPAVQWMSGAGSINKAVGDLGQTVELARTFAMANHTYVRVAFGEVPAQPPERTSPEVLVLLLYPAGGSLTTTNATAQSMGDAEQWALASQPLVLNNLVWNDALNARTPDTSADALPSHSDIVSSGSSFERAVQHIVPTPTFTACVQIDPSGEAQVTSGTPARYVKMGFDRPAPQNGKNPFIVRLGGINGRVDILRKEDGVQ